MIFTLSKSNRILIIGIAVGIALIPLFITAYKLIATNETSVVFLEGFHPTIARLIEGYYVLLLIAGLLWITLQVKAIVQLKNEKIKNELLHLQSQVSPHFFFNILNNLYGLIDVDSEKAKALILKLSELMRYSIYEGERKTVGIEEEIEYLKNYIELNRMRYYKDIDITFEIDIDKEHYKIMPLLYIILVENAFKHGVENLRKNAFVCIKLTACLGQVFFEVKNNFDSEELPKTPGIGLQNLKRRLDLVYPEKHQLIFTKINDVHTVALHLEL
ncbi:sensor histidine kinase [Flavobacteriaceae bacterium TP-CH-4]|uniref:Sensor histidine kinase n=1 Tax=Pelagihabitans pacificus TaxID=2696054 RepID=A0A967EEA6_9FLAO|nr:histidine kinase [Pelagihabitans pacificus]NHF60183.1 sensor histidine kinase [Pelagihabitans pacificus]